MRRRIAIGGSYGWYAAQPAGSGRRASKASLGVAAGRGHDANGACLECGEVATRTGLPQSAVSGCAARLKEVGSVLTTTDPADRRRSLLRQNPEVTGRRAEVAAAPVDTAVGSALGTDDPAAVAEKVDLLEQLAQRLSPQALGRLRP